MKTFANLSVGDFVLIVEFASSNRYLAKVTQIFTHGNCLDICYTIYHGSKQSNRTTRVNKDKEYHLYSRFLGIEDNVFPIYKYYAIYCNIELARNLIDYDLLEKLKLYRHLSNMNYEDFKTQYPIEAEIYNQYKNLFSSESASYLWSMLIALRQKYKKEEQSKKSSTGISDSIIQTYKESLEKLKKEKEEIENKLQNCEKVNKAFREQINSPTALAAYFTAIGFKGTLIREQPFFNTNVSMDKRVGLYTETLKIE